MHLLPLNACGCLSSMESSDSRGIKWAEDGFSLSHCLPRLCGFRQPPLLHFTLNSLLHGWSHKQQNSVDSEHPTCVPQVLWKSPSEVMHNSPWQSLPWCILKHFTSYVSLHCCSPPCLLLESSFASSSNFWHLIVASNIRKPKPPFRDATRRVRSYNELNTLYSYPRSIGSKFIITSTISFTDPSSPRTIFQMEPGEAA